MEIKEKTAGPHNRQIDQDKNTQEKLFHAIKDSAVREEETLKHPAREQALS